MAQIELIGCTGAGKSTLANSIVRICQESGINVRMSDDFVLAKARLGWVTHQLVRTILVDLFAFAACLIALPNHRRFLLFALRLISESAAGWFEKLRLVRSVFKKIGVYEIVRRQAPDEELVLVDEGTLHAAHNLFVPGPVKARDTHLSMFLRLVPLPDVAVYVTQRESVLIERTLNRGHKRIPDRSPAKVARFIRKAVATFDELARHPQLQRVLLVIDPYPSAS
jgi:thymidylate kinase